MEHEISITFGRTDNRTIIKYAPGKFPDGKEISQQVPFRGDTIEPLLESVIRDLFIIVNRACRKQPLGQILIENTLSKLSSRILPPEGFLKILPWGFDAVLWTDEDFFAIPWEMFEEKYLQCEKDPSHTQVITDENLDTWYCCKDGSPMRVVREKFGINRIVSHKVTPREPAFEPEDNNFLMIIDPLNDLCSSDSVGDDCNGLIQETYDLLTNALKTPGNMEPVDILRGSSATINNVLTNISRTDLIGIYYFGHGQPSKGSDDGRLMLSDGYLYADEIENAKPKAPFIMINACWSASHRDEWNIKDKVESVTHSFAKGTEKTVVGSLWPIVNTQASYYALKIFRSLFKEGKTAGETIREIRKESLSNFRNGIPDTAWMSYRLFGSASKKFTSPADTRALKSPFDANGKLIKSLFAFDIDEVLLRAAKRRNLYDRDLISIEDIFAGLIRKGNLLRFICLKAGHLPDKIYSRFSREGAEEISTDVWEDSYHEYEKSVPESDTLLNVNIEPWIIDSRDDFDPEALELLAASMDLARPPKPLESAALKINEKDIIEASIISKNKSFRWISELDQFMFPASYARRILDSEVDKLIDNNGILILSNLDYSARKIINTAHELAQQRGLSPIPHRLILAAFLSDKSNRIWKLFSKAGFMPDILRKTLMELTAGNAPDKFALSYESAQRTIIPLLKKIKETPRQDTEDKIDDVNLFRYFVEIADPNFKRFCDWLADQSGSLYKIVSLSSEEETAQTDDHITSSIVVESALTINDEPRFESVEVPQVDKNLIIQILEDYDMDIADYDDEVTQILIDSAGLALQQKSSLICSTHLFAAMIADGSNTLGSKIREKGINPIEIKQEILFYRRTDDKSSNISMSPKLSQNVLAVLINSKMIAHEKNMKKVSLAVLADYMLSINGVISKLFHKKGLNLCFDDPNSA